MLSRRFCLLRGAYWRVADTAGCGITEQGRDGAIGVAVSPDRGSV